MMTRFCEIDERELFSVYIMRGEKKGKKKKKTIPCSVVKGTWCIENGFLQMCEVLKSYTIGIKVSLRVKM